VTTTSGTTAFNLDLNEIIEEAFERCGVEVRTGYEHRTARRSMNLMFTEWANRGINLWTIEQGQIAMTTGTITYSLPIDTVDLIEQVIRTQSGIPQTDINISRISVDTYATIPNKNAQGRPIQVWVNRQSGQTYPINAYTPNSANPSTGVNPPNINVWPCPDQDNYYTFVYWRLRRMQDAGSGANVQDIPFRLINCMVAGLAYYLAVKIPDAAQRVPMLKEMYDEQLMLALSEDREKAPLRLAPRQLFF
jgi:hypothetical protein